MDILNGILKVIIALVSAIIGLTSKILLIMYLLQELQIV